MFAMLLYLDHFDLDHFVHRLPKRGYASALKQLLLPRVASWDETRERQESSVNEFFVSRLSRQPRHYFPAQRRCNSGQDGAPRPVHHHDR
jgi:hypothetical protein